MLFAAVLSASYALAPALSDTAPSRTETSTNAWVVNPEMKAKLIDSARDAFVEFRFRYAPYDPAAGTDPNHYWKTRSSYGDDLRQNRRTARLNGTRVPGSGGYFAAIAGDYDLEHLEAFSAVDSLGREHPAVPWAIARRGGAVWFRADGLKDAPFPPNAPLGALAKGYLVTMTQPGPYSLLDASVWAAPTPRTPRYFRRDQDKEPGTPADDRFTDTAHQILFDSSGTWRGWYLTNWSIGDRVVDAEAERAAALPWEDFRRRRTDAERLVAEGSAVVRLRFRQENAQPLEIGETDHERALKTRADIAVPLGRGLLFIPTRLSPALVQRLLSAEVVYRGKTAPARFIGVLKRLYEGYLVSCEAVPDAIGGGPMPPDNELLLVVEPRLSGESIKTHAYGDRLQGWETGYKDSLSRKPRAANTRGAVLANIEGRPFGVILEESRYENVLDRDDWHAPSPLLLLHSLDDLARDFAEPEKLIDAAVKPRTALENKRGPWFGAETQALTSDLASLLDVEGPTQNGAIGELVNVVIPGSPAEKLGLRPGDVVLRLRESGKSDEVAISAKTRASRSLPSGSPMLEFFFRRAPTGLDGAITRLQAGTRVRITYVRGASERSDEVDLIESPLDVDSAPKLVDKGTGLTVKEVTADVRRLLRLKAGFKGLVIYDVDSGSPAAVASLTPMSMLTEVAGKSVSSLTELTDILTAERAAKKTTARVRTEFFGRGTYDELRLAPEGR